MSPDILVIVIGIVPTCWSLDILVIVPTCWSLDILVIVIVSTHLP